MGVDEHKHIAGIAWPVLFDNCIGPMADTAALAGLKWAADNEVIGVRLLMPINAGMASIFAAGKHYINQ